MTVVVPHSYINRGGLLRVFWLAGGIVGFVNEIKCMFLLDCSQTEVISCLFASSARLSWDPVFGLACPTLYSVLHVQGSAPQGHSVGTKLSVCSIHQCVRVLFGIALAC